MTMTITNARSELGRVLARQVDRRQMAAHFNLAGQCANTLLHDGHRWKDFSRQMLVSTRRAMRTAVAADAPLLVHASFAFVHAVQQGAKLSEPLQSCAHAILEAEALVLDGPLPACVLRLGYLYGPESADLLAYRVAFALGRPYWSGEAKATQHHLHLWDAASALMTAAQPKNAGKTLYATDGHPLAFEPFMMPLRTAWAGASRCTCRCARACWRVPSSAPSTCSKPHCPCRPINPNRACQAGSQSTQTTARAWIRSSAFGASRLDSRLKPAPSPHAMAVEHRLRPPAARRLPDPRQRPRARLTRTSPWRRTACRRQRRP